MLNTHTHPHPCTCTLHSSTSNLLWGMGQVNGCSFYICKFTKNFFCTAVVFVSTSKFCNHSSHFQAKISQDANLTRTFRVDFLKQHQGLDGMCHFFLQLKKVVGAHLSFYLLWFSESHLAFYI